MGAFQKSISVWQGIALYVGAVVGSGILILPGLTGSVAGNNALLSWGIMIALSFPLAYAFALLARAYPSAGGVSTFVEKAFGRYMGAVIGWFYFVAAAAGQFIVPLTGGVYVTYAFHLPSWSTFIVAVVLLVSAIISNYFGLKTSGKVQLAVSGLVVLILLAVIIFAIPHVRLYNLTPAEPFSHLRAIGNGAMMIFWSFFGWEAITSLAPEFKNGKRDVLRATFGALIIVGLLYIGVAIAVVGTHSYSTAISTASQALNSASLAQVMNLTFGGGGEKVVALVALLICLGTTNAFVASISRLAYSLAHEGVAPKWLDHVNERYSTPDRGVLLVAIFSGTGLVVTLAFHLSMNTLVYIPNSLGIATYILGTAAGIKLLKSAVGKLCAGLACLMCLLAYPFIGTAIWIPAIVVVVCLSYMSWRKQRKNKLSRKVSH
ncbi:amino acid permease [Thermoactinomyces sp. CICC 10521]|uniref:APC family permease n=1 Tax=Thermoactinomyces sp. CICC 10521 TaxID=2767426 RepID=UPI0018DCBA8C|nr:amino acid permease [Thermoactinomyces sp. CICC 10521]